MSGIVTDLTTDIGKVRLEIGDTDSTRGRGKKPDGTNLTDAEIQYFLDEEGSVGRATAHACEALARAWATVPDSMRGNRSDHYSDVAKAWALQAETLRRQYGGGAIGFAMAAGFKRVDGYSEHAEEVSEM